MYTPGPWHVTPEGYVSSDSHGFVPLITPFTEDAHRDKHRGPTPEAKANARLIAAAPDLLATLEEVFGTIGESLTALDKEELSTEGFIDCMAAAQDDIGTAIRATEGE